MTEQTIETIQNLISRVEDSLKKFSLRKHKGEHFGEEEEYDARSFRDAIKEVIGSLSWLAKVARNKFLRLSTREERCTIIEALERMDNFLSQEKFDDVMGELNTLKCLVRQYDAKKEGLRYKQLLEEQIVEFKEATSELETAIEELKNRMQHVSEIADDAERHESSIDSFTAFLEAGRKQLAEQKETTDHYTEKLAQYGEQQKRILEKGQDLIAEAQSALEYTTAEGISAAYQEKYKKARSLIPQFGWLTFAFFFVVAAVAVGFDVLGAFNAVQEKIQNGGDAEIGMSELLLSELKDSSSLPAIIMRFTLIPLIVAGAWFCALQYVRNKNLAEDYSYKAVLAKSMMAFMDKIEEEDKGLFLRLLLNQMLQDPLRKSHVEVNFLKEVEDMTGRKHSRESNDASST